MQYAPDSLFRSHQRHLYAEEYRIWFLCFGQRDGFQRVLGLSDYPHIVFGGENFG